MANDLDRLAARLREAGTEGRGLRRELLKAINDAAAPLAEEIGSLEHLLPYLPDRYAAVLAADLTVGVRKSFSADPRVSVNAVAPTVMGSRKLSVTNRGVINHPVFAEVRVKVWLRANGKRAPWRNGQTAGMRPGWFTEPCEKAAPEIRDRVMRALTETADRIAR